MQYVQTVHSVQTVQTQSTRPEYSSSLFTEEICGRLMPTWRWAQFWMSTWRWAQFWISSGPHEGERNFCLTHFDVLVKVSTIFYICLFTWSWAQFCGTFLKVHVKVSAIFYIFQFLNVHVKVSQFFLHFMSPCERNFVHFCMSAWRWAQFFTFFKSTWKRAQYFAFLVQVMVADNAEFVQFHVQG